MSTKKSPRQREQVQRSAENQGEPGDRMNRDINNYPFDPPHPLTHSHSKGGYEQQTSQYATMLCLFAYAYWANFQVMYDFKRSRKDSWCLSYHRIQTSRASALLRQSRTALFPLPNESQASVLLETPRSRWMMTIIVSEHLNFSYSVYLGNF